MRKGVTTSRSVEQELSNKTKAAAPAQSAPAANNRGRLSMDWPMGFETNFRAYFKIRSSRVAIEVKNNECAVCSKKIRPPDGTNERMNPRNRE